MPKLTKKQKRWRRTKRRRTKKTESGDAGSFLGGKTWQAIPEKDRDPIRIFSWYQKHVIWTRQAGRCARTGVPLNWKTVEFDHVIPWAAGGRTTAENGEALSPKAHKRKSLKERVVHKKWV